MRRILFLLVVMVLVLTACGTPNKSKVVFVTFGQPENTSSLNINDNSGNSLLASGGSSPSLFPDGSLAYSAPGNKEFDQGNGDIWRISPNGNTVNLTDTRMVNEIRPSVSPDGSLIAYFNGGYESDLCFMRADGTDGWCLSTKSYVYTINCSLYGQQPTSLCADFDGLHINPQDFRWNPAAKDGENDLVVVSNWQGEGNKIYRLKLVSGLLAHINLIADKAVHPSISSEGILAYFDYDNESISLINLDGSENHILLSEVVRDIVWSPDGSKLAFSGYDESDISTIYFINSDGTGLEKVINGYSPVWSPDGTKMLFLRSYKNDDNNILSNHNKLFLYDLTTKSETLLHDNDAFHIDMDVIFVN